MRKWLQERAWQKIQKNCQDSDDPKLRNRLIDLVDDIVEAAVAGQTADIEHDSETTHITVELPLEPGGSAQRTIHSDGLRQYAIYTERRRLSPVIGPSLYISTLPGHPGAVHFMPGSGFATAGDFLGHVVAVVYGPSPSRSK